MTRFPGHFLSASTAALLLGGGAAFAQSSAPAAPAAPAAAPSSGDVLQKPAPRVEDLMKRLESLEERNRELEGRVTDLSRQQGEEWLGEQRAGQIRDIVRDVLADSEQRASLQDGGMTAGWNDGFFLASADGRFRMNLGGFVQSRFVWSSIQPGSHVPPAPNVQQFVLDRQANRYGFDIPNMQLWADGHVFSRDFQYMVKANIYQQLTTNINKGTSGNQAAAVPGGPDYGGFELMDAWIKLNLDDNWSVRTGQYRSPFSRGFLVLEQYQMSAARSVVDYHYALGYTRGIELQFLNDVTRFRISADNGAEDNLMGDVNAAYAGNGYKVWPTGSLGPQNAPWWAQNAAYSVTSRIDWKPSGSWDQFRSYTSPAGEPFGFLAGMGIHYQASRGWQSNQGQPFLSDPMSQWITATVDAQANFGGASLYGAFFYNNVNAPGALIPAFGDSNPANSSTDLGSMSFYAFEVQGSVYVMPKVELFGRYEFANIAGGNRATVQGLNAAIASTDAMNLFTVGVNWYLDGHDLKWTTDLGWAITDVHPWFADMEAGWRPSRANEIVFRTQLQLMF